MQVPEYMQSAMHFDDRGLSYSQPDHLFDSAFHQDADLSYETSHAAVRDYIETYSPSMIAEAAQGLIRLHNWLPDDKAAQRYLDYYVNSRLWHVSSVSSAKAWLRAMAGTLLGKRSYRLPPPHALIRALEGHRNEQLSLREQLLAASRRLTDDPEARNSKAAQRELLQLAVRFDPSLNVRGLTVHEVFVYLQLTQRVECCRELNTLYDTRNITPENWPQLRAAMPAKLNKLVNEMSFDGTRVRNAIMPSSQKLFLEAGKQRCAYVDQHVTRLFREESALLPAERTERDAAFAELQERFQDFKATPPAPVTRLVELTDEAMALSIRYPFAPGTGSPHTALANIQAELSVLTLRRYLDVLKTKGIQLFKGQVKDKQWLSLQTAESKALLSMEQFEKTRSAYDLLRMKEAHMRLHTAVVPTITDIEDVAYPHAEGVVRAILLSNDSSHYLQALEDKVNSVNVKPLTNEELDAIATEINRSNTLPGKKAGKNASTSIKRETVVHPTSAGQSEDNEVDHMAKAAREAARSQLNGTPFVGADADFVHDRLTNQLTSIAHFLHFKNVIRDEKGTPLIDFKVELDDVILGASVLGSISVEKIKKTLNHHGKENPGNKDLLYWVPNMNQKAFDSLQDIAVRQISEAQDNPREKVPQIRVVRTESEALEFVQQAANSAKREAFSDITSLY